MLKAGDTPLQKITDSILKQHGVNLWVKREDMIHPLMSGNKWRKLKYNLEAAKQKCQTILTFGGAFSNHIYATAAAGKEEGIKTIGVIRGDKPQPLNSTLQFAQDCGMQLHFISRSQYRDKNLVQNIKALKKQFGDFYLVSEGGSNSLALKGCAEIIKDIDINFDYLCTSCGTGGTLAGLLVGLTGKKRALGFSALKGFTNLEKNIDQLTFEYNQTKYHNYQVIHDYHFGGYAKFTQDLVDFMKKFQLQNEILLDPIYTGKMFLGIYDLISNGFFPQNSTVVALHTGGLQGIEGMIKYRGFPRI
ncbi:MAG: pyridoxal-phosphate dependent enzyme [Bacteroidetes bacterium]|nr:pyridoxal-phosphate dependent enzyme [Bacteroidota bacterium]